MITYHQSDKFCLLSFDNAPTINLSQNHTFEVLKKSKMEYVRNYIKNIDDKVIDEYRIDREKLFNLINDHYCKVAEDK